MAPKIHQVMAGYATGDATSGEAALFREIFRGWGLVSEIYADSGSVSPDLRGDCVPLDALESAPEDLLIHHYGIDSPALDLFLAAPGRKVMVYHNITPASFFRGFDDAVADRLKRARRRIPEIGARSDAVWADSAFNARELAELGLRDARVLPLLFSGRALDIPPDPRITAKFSGGLTNILFVGRIAPNKRVENLIQAFAWYHKAINPFSRLILVGSLRSAPRYSLMLRMLAGDLDLPNVCFEDFASPAGLPAYYKTAHAFVCASEHEGYCLPLLEAMHYGTPVIARAVGGMPEAMDGAGVLYEGASEIELAELIHRVCSDAALRSEILSGQRARIERLRARRPDLELRALLAGLID